VISSYPAESRWTGSFDGGTQCYGFAKDYDTCGSWKLTDDYAKVKTCQQCWYFNTLPDKTSVTISTDASTEVTLNTSMFYPDSAIMSIDYDTSIIDATINSGVVKFTGKSTGSTNYKILVYSDSSKSYLIGSTTILVVVE
ncbi:MAG: hypothetical protein UHS49_00625, partial [Faecalimonas sp.]|nr:hypothetical protein [Faecalimonas sp.]